MTNLHDHIKQQQERNKDMLHTRFCGNELLDLPKPTNLKEYKEYVDQITKDTIEQTVEWDREEIKKMFLSGSSFELNGTWFKANVEQITQLEDSEK